MNEMRQKKTGLYLHVPFCVQKCRYCDLSFSGSETQRQRYTEALCREIALYGKDSGKPKIAADTVFIGGGTPSLLSEKQIAGIMEAVRDSFCWTTTGRSR